MAYKGLYENEGIPEDVLKAKSVKIREEVILLVEDMELKDLIFNIMDRYGMRLCESVGSATKHHNYPGGLMEHTLEVMRIARNMALSFPDKDIDMDLITVGAFLHDMGKIVCYTDTPNLVKGGRPKKRFKGSDESKILGHFGEALLMLDNNMDMHNEKSYEKKRALLHIIASHHGEARLNWGSVVDPNTNEAHIVALADLLSSRIK